MTPEGRVKRKVRDALISLGAYFFMPVQSGIGATGLDYYCCYRGVFVAIETKRPGARLTPRQRLIAFDIIAAGGLVFVIRNEEDIGRMRSELAIYFTDYSTEFVGKGYDTLGDGDFSQCP